MKRLCPRLITHSAGIHFVGFNSTAPCQRLGSGVLHPGPGQGWGAPSMLVSWEAPGRHVVSWGHLGVPGLETFEQVSLLLFLRLCPLCLCKRRDCSSVSSHLFDLESSSVASPGACVCEAGAQGCCLGWAVLFLHRFTKQLLRGAA